MAVINWITYCHQLFDLYLDDVSIKKEHGKSLPDLHSKAFSLSLISGTHLGAINHLL